jgi:hypothetical protein
MNYYILIGIVIIIILVLVFMFYNFSQSDKNIKIIKSEIIDKNNILLEWENIPNLKEYNIFWSTDPNNLNNKDISTKESYIINTKESGCNTYYFKITGNGYQSKINSKEIKNIQNPTGLKIVQ